MKIITIPNLDKYQHYKNRNIIWIKLYVDILQDHKFQQLTNDQRWLFIGFILLAVKNNNKIPADFHYIARILLFSPKNLPKNILKLQDLNLITIKCIAKCYQPAIEKREDKIREEKKRVSSFKKLKRYYKNEEMRFSRGKWWVLPKNKGEWLEFAGDLKDTEEK